MPDINMLGNPKPDNHEAAMARADLYKSANYSFKLFKMIEDGQELEGWVQAKITKAADYIASVYHYMEYEMKFNEYGKKLEDADVYTEGVKEQFVQKLTEARVKLEKLKQKNIKDLNDALDMNLLKSAQGAMSKNKKDAESDKNSKKPYGYRGPDGSENDDDVKQVKKKSKKVKEGSKPDFLDMDKDGDKKEPMKKAVADKKKNPFPKKTTEAVGKCNHTAKGKSCPVHGLKECGMTEGSKNPKQQAAVAMAKKQAK